MRSRLLPVTAAVLGVGLLTVGRLQAQSKVVGSGDHKTVIGSTAGPVNATLDRSPTRTDQSGVGLIQMKDLLNYRIVAQDGGFGQVADVVFDRNGRIQYLLGTYDGKIFPLPFMRSAMNPSGSTLTYNVPMATLEQMALDPHHLPSLNNQAFVQRMQQVFGPSFGIYPNQTVSAYPPTGDGVGTTGIRTGTTAGRTSTAVPTPTGRMEKGPTRPTGGSLNSDRGIEPRIEGTGNSTTSASGALSGAAIGGAPGSTGGTSGTAGGAPAHSPGAGTGRPANGPIGGTNGTGGTGGGGSGSGATGSSSGSGS
jgi:hypothetical protein